MGWGGAASARQRGCRVHVLESQDGLMKRAVPPAIGRFFERLHGANGVDIQLGVTIRAFAGESRLTGVVLDDGGTLGADLVIVGVGIIPNVEIAEEAGLAIDNGVVVDEFGRTSDPDIFAAGDLTNHPNAVLGRRIRLESWQNAQNQGIAAARAMIGQAKPYAEAPWFWSDQYDVNLQMVGLPERWDSLLFRG